MRIVIQRVSASSVHIDGQCIAKIGQGLNLLVGIEKGDSQISVDKAVNKIINLRIFNDQEGKMNLNVKDTNGELLIVSQFTLAGSIDKGRRPSFDKSEEPDKAQELYQYFIDQCSQYCDVQAGRFGAMMKVDISNDGPVTFIADIQK